MKRVSLLEVPNYYILNFEANSGRAGGFLGDGVVVQSIFHGAWARLLWRYADIPVTHTVEASYDSIR